MFCAMLTGFQVLTFCSSTKRKATKTTLLVSSAWTDWPTS